MAWVNSDENTHPAMRELQMMIGWEVLPNADKIGGASRKIICTNDEGRLWAEKVGNFKFLKNFKSDAYFPLYKICKNLISKISSVSQKKEDFVNTYFLKNIEKKINTPLQSPPFELSESEIEKSLNITFTHLKKFKKFTNEIYLIYIPSPATVLDLKNPIIVQKYFPDRDISNKLSKNEISTANRKIVDKIMYFCENNNFTFYNLTPNLIEYSRYNLSYGPIDFKHPRVNVYNYMLELISKNILSKN